MQNHFILDAVMLSISKIRTKFSGTILIVGFLFSASAMADDKCDIEKLKHTEKSISDVLCDKKIGTLYLKYNKKNRLIWLESEDHKFFYKLIKLESNADPGLVGEEESIVFVTPEIIDIINKRFIGLTFARRSRTNNGGGQCGSGSEKYFVSIEISPKKLIERKRFLIDSCVEPLELDYGDGSTIIKPVIIDGDKNIIFKWLSYPGYESVSAGIFNFHTNELKVFERQR